MSLYISGARPSSLPPADGEAAGERTGWWTTPYGRWRLFVEVEAMERFPSFRSCWSPCGDLCWLGEMKSSLDPENRYLVKVTYPRDFPDAAPEVTIEEPALAPGTPHVLDGSRPCLYRATHGPRNGYDPARTTAATLVGWTALWIHAFETWQATDRWPGSEE